MAKRHSTTLIPAAGYLRRSTAKQEKSLEDQRREIERYAAQHGYRIVRWYQDDAISGDDTEKRLGFQQMHRDACSDGGFEVIVCWDQDRLAGSPRRRPAIGPIRYRRRVCVWLPLPKGRLIGTTSSSGCPTA